MFSKVTQLCQKFISPFLILLILVGYQWIFRYHFDATYFEEWYNHSQWNIPKSPRIMGDNDLYQFAGYKLLQGDDIFHITPEVPPLGKYLYGFGIQLTNNPHMTSLILYFLTVLLFWQLTKLFFTDRRLVFWSMLFFLLNPIFFAQIGQTGLDLPQLCFLLLHVILVLLIGKNSKHSLLFAAGAGLTLGCFTATKIAVFTPVIFLADAWYLWHKKQLKLVAIIALLTPLPYLLSYTSYFLQHHTLIEWLRAQKWMFNFYRSAKQPFIPGMVIFSLITGQFSTWWDGIIFAKEWTVFWTLSFITFVITFFTKQFWITKNSLRSEWQLLAFLSLGLLVANCIIPFWPRYVILMMPFFILFFVRILEHVRWRWLLVATSLVLLCQMVWYLFPQPTEEIQYIKNTWKTGSYAELYSFTDAATRATLSRNEFDQTLKVLDFSLTTAPRLDHAEIIFLKKIEIQPVPLVLPWQNQVHTELKVSYELPFGVYSFTQPVTLVREHNRWRLQWSWDLALPSFTPTTEVQLQREVRQPSVNLDFISVIPAQVAEGEKMVDQLVEVTDEQGPNIRLKLFVFSPTDRNIPIGFISKEPDQEILKELKAHPAIVIEQRPTNLTPDQGRLLLKVQDQPETILFSK